MIKVKFYLKNERGFLLLNVIFLLLITSFAATIMINAAQRAKNPQASLRLIALYLANGQIARLESSAAAGDEPLNGEYKDGEFTVKTEVNSSDDLREVAVKVSWSDKDFIEVERTILFVPKKNT